MALADLCRSFVATARDDRAGREQIIKDARRLLLSATSDEWNWLSDALDDDERKWFVAASFSRSPVPTRLLKPMIRAAVYEVNPSLNREFVSPCIASYGHRVVNEALLDVVENGTDFEKAGAVNALYWAGMKPAYTGNTQDFTVENATPDSRAAYLELSDVWDRKRCLFLREFVSNENVDVRRSIIPSLCLDEAAYREVLKPLVSKAIDIARNHQDEYIRHRVEVQLGEEHLLYPRPHRTQISGRLGDEGG
jgi:hypothetical protein